jgi:GrpB-like predicted nucleotidyltransferase (UPF0157 family)
MSPLAEDPRSWPANLFHSAEEYWQGRSSMAAYQIDVAPYSDGWPLAFQSYRDLLLQSVKAAAGPPSSPPPFKQSQVFHIGSTSIVGCPAKPVIDMMIMTSNPGCGSFRSCVLAAWTAAACCPDLNFDVGFCDEEKEWAMFQIVKATADGRPGNVLELNVHLYPAPVAIDNDDDGTSPDDISRAQEKLELVAYLRDASAPARQHLDEYVGVKRALSLQVEAGELDAAGDSKAKNGIVSKVLKAARVWVLAEQLDMPKLMAMSIAPD